MSDEEKWRGSSPRGVRAPSRKILPEWVPEIKKRILQGEFLNRIAADYDVNPGRISEIKAGFKFSEIPPAT
ncbi:hypothetical protein GR183_20605 [Stappia sp. GBMRC 2046]|uniref:Uncharacterized protein n=1 Tax=Stappia sediminis TaxID=2692190 RepID=A0A7X3LYA0_9HYPH|nr:hypothetical protein [Stappia sediminis]MXN67315.1 hypothetical protein [Stappia sediminis]